MYKCTDYTTLNNNTGCDSHPCRALVTRITGDRQGAPAPLCSTGALEHAGMEACMSPGMFSQVVAPHEALVTHWTVEALLARVCAIVTCQFI